MAQQTINVGAAPNDGTGTPLRTAFQYTNSNFSELYTATGPSGNNITVPGTATITGDLTVDTNTLKVDSANNRVGIGTASPTEVLTVNNSFGATTGGIRVYANDQSQARLSIQNINGQAYHLVAGNPGASNAGFALYDNTAAATRLWVDNTGVHTWQNVGGVAGTAMTLNSTGLGVGTGTINAKVDAQGASSLIGFRYIESTSGGLNRVQLGAGSGFAYIDANASLGFPVLQLRAAGNTAVTIDSSLNVGIGVTPSAGKGCLQLSSGINFPATQVASSDANTLDDYEEGTWTGTLTGGTTNPTTPVTATGRYTKVGRVVTVQITFLNANTTGASGLIGITGLPFANNGSSSSAGAVSLYLIGTFTGSPFASLGVNESFINFFANVSGGAFNDVTHNAGTPRFLTTSITYTV